MALLRHHSADKPFFVFLSAIQIALLPLSLTPSNYPIPPISTWGERYHTYLIVPHAILFTIGIRMMLLQETWQYTDALRWAVPEIIVGAVEMQRMGERDVEGRLRAWEGTQYRVKGA